ncbi:MAG TPA: hypothetical protein VJZ91_05680, partial [Blastocatellia bacterium]|nr:hypothetical protein [Blastocatellia bacterium]
MRRNRLKALVKSRAVAFLVMLLAVSPAINLTQTAAGSPVGIPVATQTDIVGPPGSGRFGTSVTALPNGNIVITDPTYSTGGPTPVANVGAVYLYNGATGAMISMLTGSNANDRVGMTGVTVLSSGNYVVRSSVWNGGSGAVTWGSSTAGVSGVVSAANSLVGSTTEDSVGNLPITELTNGNYVVRTPTWHNVGATLAGAVTWGSGTAGVSGTISAANSLVGDKPFDEVGTQSVTALANGNYVVSSPNWANGGSSRVGAVTWGNGATGTSGIVSPSNSLVGSTEFDSVGVRGVTALTNGNYVVSSPVWDNGAVSTAGAATWGNGATGTVGVVSAANSLVGGLNDLVSLNGVTALANGNYVVITSGWRNGADSGAGAVTWGNGATGTSGLVSAANSLVGGMPQDFIGIGGVTALTNGNYVVRSPGWNVNAGAATWGNGATGTSGVVSAANSLVGTTAFDRVSFDGITALANGNYVVSSASWNGFRGAVTWGNGTTGISGMITAANSLFGGTLSDQVGVLGVTALANGNYVVRSPFWDNGGAVDAGAATWGNGAAGTTGVVSAANSLVGSASQDRIGNGSLTALTNGNYVV